MSNRLMPDNTSFSSIMNNSQSLTEEQIQQKINDTFNRLIDERVNNIVEKKIKSMKSSNNDSFLPIGTVVLTYTNPFLHYLKLKDNEKRDLDKKIHQYELEMRKKGFVLLGHYNLNEKTKTVLSQSEYPEFLKYLHAMDQDVNDPEIKLAGGYSFNISFRTGEGVFDFKELVTTAWVYVGRPVGKLNTDHLYE